jgi:hypothetical protein
MKWDLKSLLEDSHSNENGAVGQNNQLSESKAAGVGASAHANAPPKLPVPLDRPQAVARYK